MYNESISILRFVGRQYGYYPPEYHDMWQCDAIVDYVNDFIPKVAKIIFIDKNFTPEGMQEYLSIITTICTFLTKKLAHGKDFLIGDKITIADF